MNFNFDYIGIGLNERVKFIYSFKTEYNKVKRKTQGTVVSRTYSFYDNHTKFEYDVLLDNGFIVKNVPENRIMTVEVDKKEIQLCIISFILCVILSIIKLYLE